MNRIITDLAGLLVDRLDKSVTLYLHRRHLPD